jgi:hypothetical protein
MKNTQIIILSALFLLSAFFCYSQQSWKAGDRCLANWTQDDYWYPGTIVEVKNNQYFILFDDLDMEWLPSDRLKQENLGEGSVVYANWQFGGYYYKGKIDKRLGFAIYIIYDDGDEEWTTISAVRVLF